MKKKICDKTGANNKLSNEEIKEMEKTLKKMFEESHINQDGVEFDEARKEQIFHYVSKFVCEFDLERDRCPLVVIPFDDIIQLMRKREISIRYFSIKTNDKEELKNAIDQLDLKQSIVFFEIKGNDVSDLFIIDSLNLHNASLGINCNGADSIRYRMTLLYI